MAEAAPHYDLALKEFSGTGKLGDCPFCHRALLTMHYKGVPFSSTLIDFANKPQWLLEASQGKVPVLRAPTETPPLVMPDSDVIVAYLEEKFPEVPMGTTDTSVGGKVFPSFRAFLFAPAGSPEEGEKKEALLAELKALNALLSQPGAGPLVGGKSLSATDAALAPKLYHVEVALKHYKNFTIPEDLKAVHAYLAYVKTLPAWQACDYGHEAILDGWKRHLAAAH